jgi:hypothetical protein
MSSLVKLFKFATNPTYDGDLPNIFPFSVDRIDFINSDIKNIFSKILTDCLEKTQGIPEKFMPSFWDNCLVSEANKGLITLLAEAIANKHDLFLTYREGVLRRATFEEISQIKVDYERTGSSPVGVYISFKHYQMIDILKVYSGMEYDALCSLHKSMNVAKSLQFKMSNLRASVGALDATITKEQAKTIACGLRDGKDVLLDGDDEIVTATVDMEPTEKAIRFLDAKRSFYLGLPISYITGEQTGGIGSTGEGDTKAIERGLRAFWISILKPAVSAIFGVEKIKFRSQDFRQIDSALNAIRTFELVSDDLISLESKRLIVSTLLDIENDLKGKPKSEPEEIEQTSVAPNEQPAGENEK